MPEPIKPRKRPLEGAKRARRRDRRKTTAISRKEYVDRYNVFHNNLQLMQIRLLEAMRDRNTLDAIDLNELKKLRVECFKLSVFFQEGMEAWPKQMHNALALMTEYITYRSGKIDRDPKDSISFRRAKNYFRKNIGKRIYFGGWTGPFEEAYLRTNLEANTIVGRELSRLVAKAEASGKEIDRIGFIRAAEIDYNKVQEEAIVSVFGELALQEYRKWKQGKPEGNISMYLQGLVEPKGQK